MVKVYGITNPTHATSGKALITCKIIAHNCQKNFAPTNIYTLLIIFMTLDLYICVCVKYMLISHYNSYHYLSKIDLTGMVVKNIHSFI